MSSPRHVIAWDIETVPLRPASYSERQQRRAKLLLDEEIRRKPDADIDELSRLVRSLHPMLGRICCISLVRMDAAGTVGRPKSYTAAVPGDEIVMLRQFWADVSRLPSGGVRWVTFNGKRFDVDWLKVRSAALGLVPSRRDILDTYPYKQDPHCDLARVFDCRSGLDDLCDLVGVASPKGELDGSGVAAAVDAGLIESVAEYCERDVVATLGVYSKLEPQI